MDLITSPPKSPVLASEMSTKSQAVTIQPLGSEATQTVQAVQAANKTSVNHSLITDQSAQELTTEQLTDMAKQMDSFVGSFNRELKFRVDEESGRNVVSVIDTKSGDTIRQIPTEELLDVITRLAEASGGLIYAKA